MIKRKKLLIILISLLIIVLIFIFYQIFSKQNIEKIKDSVVLVNVYDEEDNLLATGSGFCAYKNNYIITNFHVIEGASNLEIVTDDKIKYNVNKIVFFNQKEDLAVLSIDGELRPLELGNGSKIKSKDKVTAIGSPMGEQNTISEGIISNADENDIIRITVPISHGSSGGVLLNNKNQVIGITSAGYNQAQNLNFAININILKNIYNDYENKKYDKIDETNYDKCIPDILNYNTHNDLKIKDICDFSAYYNYSVDDMNSFYLATNQYSIFNTKINELGINGFNNNYKNFSKNKKLEATTNYSSLLKYETCDTKDNEVIVCELDDNISSWTPEQFIMELDLLKTYELAILMVEIDEHLYSMDALVDYLNDTNLDYDNKIILNKLFNKSDNRYNDDIIKVFDKDDKISYDQEVDLLKYLGMSVDSNGNVRW